MTWEVDTMKAMSSTRDVPGEGTKVEENICCCLGDGEGHGVGALDIPVVIAQVEEALRCRLDDGEAQGGGGRDS